MENPKKTDILLNVLAVSVAGVVGLGMFFFIGAHYGPSVLGVFNKVFAVYLVSSQISAFGLPVSVLRRLAPLRGDVQACRASLWGALLATVPAVVLTAVPLYVAAPALGRLGLGADTAVGLRWAAGALLAFACTKILLAGLNALARLRAYALCNALRYILLFLGVVGHAVAGLDFRDLPAVLLCAEGLLLLLLLFFLRDVLFGRAGTRRIPVEAGGHARFGLRAFGGNLVQDLNTRIDVICLGLFLPDAAVGIYSMAALPAEAAAQLPMVLRVAYSPKMMVLLAEKDAQGLAECIRKVRLAVRLFMGAAALIAAGLYPVLVPWLTGRTEFARGSGVFALLMAGVVVGAGWAPFANLPAGAGRPGLQSLICGAAFVLNLCGNLLLIPVLGLWGAALASLAAQVLTVALLRGFARRSLELSV